MEAWEKKRGLGTLFLFSILVEYREYWALEVESPNDSSDEVKAITHMGFGGPGIERGTDLPSRAPSRGRM